MKRVCCTFIFRRNIYTHIPFDTIRLKTNIFYYTLHLLVKWYHLCDAAYMLANIVLRQENKSVDEQQSKLRHINVVLKEC